MKTSYANALLLQFMPWHLVNFNFSNDTFRELREKKKIDGLTNEKITFTWLECS